VVLVDLGVPDFWPACGGEVSRAASLSSPGWHY